MTKVVRAFSLDPRVSETLDEMTSVPGRSKPMNKSRYVNEALDWYMNKNLGDYQKEVIESRNFLVSNINEKRVIIGGLEGNIASLEIQLEQIMEERACQCLWCRLKRRLQRSRVEQQEQ
jgi:hypothetical protein